jgi:hypothetical protein
VAAFVSFLSHVFQGKFAILRKILIRLLARKLKLMGGCLLTLLSASERHVRMGLTIPSA